jgi:addiction module HigA family antidote
MMHPGQRVRQRLEELQMTQVDFARRMGISTKLANQVVKEKVRVTHDFALKAEYVLGIPMRELTDLQLEIDLDRARERTQQRTTSPADTGISAGQGPEMSGQKT